MVTNCQSKRGRELNGLLGTVQVWNDEFKRWEVNLSGEISEDPGALVPHWLKKSDCMVMLRENNLRRLAIVTIHIHADFIRIEL